MSASPILLAGGLALTAPTSPGYCSVLPYSDKNENQQFVYDPANHHIFTKNGHFVLDITLAGGPLKEGLRIGVFPKNGNANQLFKKLDDGHFALLTNLNVVIGVTAITVLKDTVPVDLPVSGGESPVFDTALTLASPSNDYKFTPDGKTVTRHGGRQDGSEHLIAKTGFISGVHTWRMRVEFKKENGLPGGFGMLNGKYIPFSCWYVQDNYITSMEDSRSIDFPLESGHVVRFVLDFNAGTFVCTNEQTSKSHTFTNLRKEKLFPGCSFFREGTVQFL